MPNYVTHAVMGEIVDVPNRRLDLDKEKLSVFSLGQDLLFSDSQLFCRAHSDKSSEFFYNLINYIRENKLYDNPLVMAYLYGHIEHYELDKTCHPFINYMTDGVKKHGFVDFHLAYEEYLGDLVLHCKSSTPRNKFFESSRFSVFSKSVLEHLIDSAYNDTYGSKFVCDTVRKSSSSIRNLNIARNLLDKVGPDTYFRLLGLNSYFDVVKLNPGERANETNETWYNPISKERHTESFIELFDKACESSKGLMEEVDSIIYSDKLVSSVPTIFGNLSYDTGIPCDVGDLHGISRYKSLCKKSKKTNM